MRPLRLRFRQACGLRLLRGLSVLLAEVGANPRIRLQGSAHCKAEAGEAELLSVRHGLRMRCLWLRDKRQTRRLNPPIARPMIPFRGRAHGISEAARLV